MNSMNLKFGDVTARRSPTFSDCHYVKKIMLILYYCLLFMFSNFWYIIKRVCHLLILCHNMSPFIVSMLHFIFWWPAYFIDTSLWMQFNEFIEFNGNLWKNSKVSRPNPQCWCRDWRLVWTHPEMRLTIIEDCNLVPIFINESQACSSVQE